MIKRGQYVKMSYDENPHIVLRVTRSGGYVCHRIDKKYSETYRITVPGSNVEEASILNIHVSEDFINHLNNMWKLKGEFIFETKLLKSWDLAANFQYDFISLHNILTDKHILISYEHVCRIRRSKVTEIIPGRKLTDYEYLHKFKCKKLWKVNTREILRASR